MDMKFWKKESEPDDDPFKHDVFSKDPFAADPNAALEHPATAPGLGDPAPQPRMDSPRMDTMSPMSQPQPYHEAPPQQPTQGNRDMELILSKLDAIKSQLEVLNHRIEKIEGTQPRRPSW